MKAAEGRAAPGYDADVSQVNFPNRLAKAFGPTIMMCCVDRWRAICFHSDSSDQINVMVVVLVVVVVVVVSSLVRPLFPACAF